MVGATPCMMPRPSVCELAPEKSRPAAANCPLVEFVMSAIVVLSASLNPGVS
jgi:hypothetical protein